MLKLSSSVAVKIRFNSIDLGTTRWKEGIFEIVEKENKVNLCIRFISGGPPKTFQLNHNIKKVVHTSSRLMVTLKDSSVVILDSIPSALAQKVKEYLEKVKQGKSTVLKPSHGSASFSILGNWSVKKESCPSGERQDTPRRQSLDREETIQCKPLGSPSRVISTPARSGLSENSNNKATSNPCSKFLQSCKDKLKQAEDIRSSVTLLPAPLQATLFYSSRSVTKDYSQSHSFPDRPPSTTPTKRSLMMPKHSTPFKKKRPITDYGGWNRPRPSTMTQSQPALQGFSNLGNTCYMNAILQSLFSLPSFSNDLLKQGIPWKKVPANALLRRFAHLLAKKDVSCPDMKKDLLRRVKSAISSTAERFSGYMQNDAHEFLSQCLDQLKEDVEKINKSWKRETAAIPAVWEEPQQFATRSIDDTDSSHIYTCPVVVNMEFEVQHTITCKGCGEVVTKREQFNDLSIDLPRRKKTIPLRSIQDSLDLFFRMEEIAYSCEKCSAKTATVTHKFSGLPRVLILHLKRYSYNAQLSLNSKLGQQVVIPRYLTLLSHCTDETRPPPSLGGKAHPAMLRTFKVNQSVNSSSTNPRKICVKTSSSSSIQVDSDSEDEPSRKVAIRKRRFCDCMPDSERPDEIHQSPDESANLNEINDDEMLAAVFEMSRHDDGPPLDDEPTSSPDTGFGDVQELAYHTELIDTEKKQSADDLDSLDLTIDENKENKTPEGVQGELDWVQQYSIDQEREEQELQQALAQSLQEHEAEEMREDDDLKRATELSLQDFNNSLPELLCSDEDSGNEDVLDMEYSETEAEDLRRNAESGDLANSFRLISVVSHIGSSSSSGHYISDVYDMKKQSWLTFNDLDVSRTQESNVQRDRDRSGYIFFYMHKDVFEELSDLEKAGGSSSEAGRSVLQAL